MQGWSATSHWTGVRLTDLMAELGPRPEGARYIPADSSGLAQEMSDNRPREPFYVPSALATSDEEESIVAYARQDRNSDTYLLEPSPPRLEPPQRYHPAQ